MRAVLDTNIVLSGMLWGGKPALLLKATAEAKLTIFTSEPLIKELRSVLARPKMVSRSAQIGLNGSTIIHEYLTKVQIVIPLTPVRVAADPDDDHVLAAAQTAKAELIVSGDRHLLILEQFQGIPIVSVAEALERIEAAGQERSVH